MESMIHLAAHIVPLQKAKASQRHTAGCFQLQRRERIWLELRPPIPIQRWALFHLIVVLACWCGDYVLHRWESASVK